MYNFQVKYNKALDINKKVVSLQEKILDKNDPKLSMSYNKLALAHNNLGDYELARDLLKRVLESDLKTIGEDHRFTSASRSNWHWYIKILGIIIRHGIYCYWH